MSLVRQKDRESVGVRANLRTKLSDVVDPEEKLMLVSKQ